MLTRAEIVSGLRELGLRGGDVVMVHSSLSALGDVQGGADAVIDALAEAVGPEGMILAPTFGCNPPFDRKQSTTSLGAIADHLWRRPGAARSMHPMKSVAALGNGAVEFVAGHEACLTAHGEGTPYHKLITSGAKVLLIGVDQDANSTLHTAEVLAGVPYLSKATGCYISDSGSESEMTVCGVSDSHRDFTALDRIFRERGVMCVGRIGGAVCRLLDAKGMIDVAMGVLARDPSAVLCRNPSCDDCVRSRSMVKAARLNAEGLTVAAVAGEINHQPDAIVPTIKREGISALEITAREYRRYGSELAAQGVRVVGIRGRIGEHDSMELAGLLNVPLIVTVSGRDELDRAAEASRDIQVLVENCRAPVSAFLDAYSSTVGLPKLALNPAEFASVGDRPLHDVILNSSLRRHVARLYISDATSAGRPTMPGEGNGQVKEILSALRCRGFDGVVTLRAGLHNTRAFPRVAELFWQMLDTM